MSGYVFRPGIAIKLAGIHHFAVTVDVSGYTFQDHFDVPIAGFLAHEVPIDKIAHTRFSGDIAWRTPEAQHGLGFNTTETGKYKAHRVGTCSLATPPALG